MHLNKSKRILHKMSLCRSLMTVNRLVNSTKMQGITGVWSQRAGLLPSSSLQARWMGTQTKEDPNQPPEEASEPTQDPTDLQRIIDEQVKQDEDEMLPNGKGKKGSPLARVAEFQMKELDTYDRGEHDVTEVTDDMPLNLRERKQTAIVYETFREKAQWGEFYRVYGLALLALGGYFLSVPFYNVICQTFGFSMSQHAKDYSRKDEEVNVYRKFRVGFLSHTQDEIPWAFEPSTA
jgi:hypothetical protein